MGLSCIGYPCAMSSLRVFRIEFERQGATYLAGELVKGKVVLDTTKEKYITALNCTAKGSASVYWTESSSTSNSNGDSETTADSYSNSQEYFKIKSTLLRSIGGDSKVRITEGYHEYPFEFLLPCNIPSSFEHGTGYIRYTVKSELDRPWKFNHECKAAFTVISTLDLNLHREKCLGILDDVQKNFCCFCCISMGSLFVTTRIPSSGYVPGQMIITTVVYKNFSSSVQMTKINAKLERVLDFHATSKTKTEYFEITSNSYSGPFPLEGQAVIEIRVPPIPPSYLTHCSIIDLNYNLKIIVHFTGPHCKIEKRFPLVIGTIPIQLTPAAAHYEETETGKQPPSSVPMPQPQVSRSSIPDRHIGLIFPGQTGTSNDWRIPPPSYEESVSGAKHIRDANESDYVYGASTPFLPKYPVFNYPVQNTPHK